VRKEVYTGDYIVWTETVEDKEKIRREMSAREQSVIIIIIYVLYFIYALCDFSTTFRDTTKNLGVIYNSKLHFHAGGDYIFSQSVWMLYLIRALTYSFSQSDSLLILYLTPVTHKLQYASAV
jgi:hypothetical protein